MSPEDLILAAYDIAIQSCEKRDSRRAGEAIVELMNGLDFTYQEMGGNLLVLYDYIYRRLREGAFDEAQKFLQELRDTWAQSLRGGGGSQPKTHAEGREATDTGA